MKTGTKADFAAGIEFNFVPVPETLPDEFRSRAAGAAKFLNITTIDGRVVDAVLLQPVQMRPEGTTLAIVVHGSGGNYAKGVPGFVSYGLFRGGYAALAINTRQHDGHVNSDNFWDIRRDIDAAYYTALALGYSSILLIGHSLGNIQVQYYAATNWDRAIKGVILLAPFANLPWKSRFLLVQDEENYRALISESMDALKTGDLDQPLTTKMRGVGGRRIPVTAQHFLTYRYNLASAADGTFWIRRIPRPILLARDAADDVVQAFEPHMLLAAALAEGSLVNNIQYELLENDREPSSAAHNFADNQDQLVTVLKKWLATMAL